MSTTPASASPTPSAIPSRTTSKSSKTKVLTLKLPRTILSQFPSDVPARKPTKSKPLVPSATASPAPDAQAVASSPPQEGSIEEGASVPAIPEENATDDIATQSGEKAGEKRKETPTGAAKGRKPPTDENGNPKPRGKPGPKKRKGLEGENGTLAAAPQKLGPKANQGAINAQLRALDRTGKQSRRWQRQGFQFSSFTGTRWELAQWNTPKLESFEGDIQSEHTGSSDQARNSIVPSDRSNHGDDGTLAVPMDIASSPAPQAADVVMAT